MRSVVIGAVCRSRTLEHRDLPGCGVPRIGILRSADGAGKE